MSDDILEEQLIEIIRNKDLSEDIKLAKIDMLIKLGVDVNAMYGARSVLNFADFLDEMIVVELLKNNGAKDIFDEEKSKELGLELIDVCYKGNFEKLDDLIDKGADLNQKGEFGNIALLGVINKKEVLEFLIDNGARVDLEGGFDDWTALISASFVGNKEIVEFLISKGADVNKQDRKNYTALMQAVSYGNKEVAEVLLKNGAYLNYGEITLYHTALMEAAESGKIEFVELLIKYGAKLDIRDRWGYTALMLASKNGHEKVVKMLIQNGADVHQKNDDGKNAIMLAKNKKIRRAIMTGIKAEKRKAFLDKIKKGLGFDK